MSSRGRFSQKGETGRRVAGASSLRNGGREMTWRPGQGSAFPRRAAWA